MTITTVGVVSAVTPSVIETYISHYLNHGALKKKPTAHISYHEGLRLVRTFLDYSSKHAVEDIQSFTAQWVPAPSWVKIENVEIPHRYLHSSAKLLHSQLGAKGIEQVGGKDWWQWRRPESGSLRAEWVEMKKDIAERKRLGTTLDRAMLYVHGGAYYFGSVDEHRYQIQRHARKLKTRVLAPRYRLAPQFPFPCGLHDCIAAYLFLLDSFKPSQILVAGDSAGGGMVLSMLVTLRDQGIPLPAGGILLSPWVDLTHSFPSVAGEGNGDYIPSHGFHHRPSLAWPPPNADDLAALKNELATVGKSSKKGATGINVLPDTANESKRPSENTNLTIEIDGELIEIIDQIQMYAENSMLAHPLVSPIQQPSLGGLPPLLIQTGGAELLHDEQVYLAHKAANPLRYRPADAVFDEYDLAKDDITKYDPTYVQLQVWEDLCHVPHTLSFTRPAKYMFRSVAQFGAWALAHAQHKDIDIEDDANSIISSGTDTDNETSGSSIDMSVPRRPRTANKDAAGNKRRPIGGVGKAGDPLPPFRDHMIRQRVDRHGLIYPLTPAIDMPFLHLEPRAIGTIKPTPVRKWLLKKQETEARYASEKRKVQKKRLKEMSQGYERFPNGDRPPPTALAGRRRQDMPAEKKAKKSWALSLWAGWGWHHDEETIERNEKSEQAEDQDVPRLQETASISETDHAQPPPSRSGGLLSAKPSHRDVRRVSSTSMLSVPQSEHENGRPRSAYRRVSDIGQASDEPPLPTMETHGSKRSMLTNTTSTASPALSSSGFSSPGKSDAPRMSEVSPESVKVDGSENTFISSNSSRPHNNNVAYPFKLRQPLSSASIGTLDDASSVDGGSATARSTPAASMAPLESMIAEKEVIMPTYDEKEVVVVNAPPPHLQRPPIDRMPSELSALPNSSPVTAHASDGRTPKPDAYSPAAHSAIRSAAPASRSGSPVETYRPRDELRTRSPALNPSASIKYSDDAQHSPGLPRPVGSAYNPRDLRNAMLNRNAVESATPANGSLYEGSPRVTPMASPQPPHGFAGVPVELPAMPHSPTSETNAMSTGRRPSAISLNISNEPVELSTVKHTRNSVLPVPRPNAPTLELSAVKQTRNSVLPNLGVPANRSELPSSPLVSSPMANDSEDESDAESLTFRAPSSAESTDRDSSEDSHRDTSVVERTPKSRSIPPPVQVKPMKDDDSLPPTPPPKDVRFAGSSLSQRRANRSFAADSPKTTTSSYRPDSSDSEASEELPKSRASSKPPTLGEMSFGGGLGFS